MSEPGELVQLWEAPYFEQPAQPGAQPPLAELEALAQAQGFQSGREEGLAEGRAEAQSIVGAIAELAEQIAQPFQGLDATVCSELAQMAMQLAAQIVRRELAIDSSVVSSIVTEALGTLYELDGEIVIFMNPADASLFTEFAPQALQGKTWKIIEDPAMSRGGCQVKTPSSFVDASVERQMEVVFADLLEASQQGMES